MVRLAALLWLLLYATSASGDALPPPPIAPEVPPVAAKPFAPAELTADQRVAYYAWRRALAAEADASELNDELRQLRFQMARGRKECS